MSSVADAIAAAGALVTATRLLAFAFAGYAAEAAQDSFFWKGFDIDNDLVVMAVTTFPNFVSSAAVNADVVELRRRVPNRAEACVATAPERHRVPRWYFTAEHRAVKL